MSEHDLPEGTMTRRRGKRGRDADRPSEASRVDPAIAGPVRAAVAAHRGQRGSLLPILHAVQDELGCVPPDAVPVLAEELNLSRADVYGVITFYDDFRSEPVAGPAVRICRAEACQALGAEPLHAYAADLSGITVGPVFCLGNCALGPSVQIDGRVYGRVDPVRLQRLVDAATGTTA